MKLIPVLLLALAACTPANQKSMRTATNTGEAEATVETVDSATGEKKPIYLPSQDKTKGVGNYPMAGVRPNEVCMEKGWNWLYAGYLKPECGTCHYVNNRFNVTAFGQPDVAAALGVMRTSVDVAVLLEAVVTNTFCKDCTIKTTDPLFADLEYFTKHMNSCEQPQP